MIAFRAAPGVWRGEETGWNPVQLPLLCLQESAVRAREGQPFGITGEGGAAGAGAVEAPQCISQKTGDRSRVPGRGARGRVLIWVHAESGAWRTEVRRVSFYVMARKGPGAAHSCAAKRSQLQNAAFGAWTVPAVRDSSPESIEAPFP